MFNKEHYSSENNKQQIFKSSFAECGASASSPPQLNVGDELVALKNETLSLTCNGSKPLDWKTPIPAGEGVYVSNLFIFFFRFQCYKVKVRQEICLPYANSCIPSLLQAVTIRALLSFVHGGRECNGIFFFSSTRYHLLIIIIPTNVWSSYPPHAVMIKRPRGVSLVIPPVSHICIRSQFLSRCHLQLRENLHELRQWEVIQ